MNTSASRRILLPVAALLALLAAPFSLHAQTDGTWTNTAGGSWGTASNWSGSTIATGQDATATVTDAPTGNITLDTAYTIGNLVFGNSTINVTGNSFTLSTSTGTPTITTSGSSSNVTITSGLAGTQGFTKTGFGILYIGATSSISGVIEVSQGQIGFKNSATVSGASFQVDSGATLNIGQSTTYSNAVTLNGGTLNVQGSATYNGNVTLTADSTISRNNPSSTFGNTSTTIGNDYNLTLIVTTGNGTGAQTIASAITGTGNITVQASTSGPLNLSGTNTYSGLTTVSTGTLALTGTGSIANSTAYNIAAGAKFDVSGLTTPGYSLANAATTLGLGATTSGLINVGTGTLTLGGTSNLTLNFTAVPTAPTFSLYTAGNVSGDFQGVSITGALGSGFLALASGVWSGTFDGYNLSLNEASGVLTVASAIPEPATTASLLGGVSVLAILISRRRQKDSDSLTPEYES